ncbi:protein kinase 4 [Anastrepha ludens]|uniref:protein kinase 4 n=1 Tax=Anastrepha ludens TaxID=28586 RepID=UPI0023AF1A9C|nr:protein kinase 4 [Anastrepha ludens]XP_053950512.1 protein kinase 4 [Anastrepha ludens]
MLTDCSSIQGSTASSSSDVMTLATTASWCAISIPSSASAAATSARLRILRLIRPHARRILVTPDTSPSFGFTVRGGKEFGTGFFVSSVERNSEAELKGMRIGDQILRINGFRVDDAIHRELIQFITNQDRITIKVRSVGMLPIKEKDNEKLSWHAVKAFTNGSSASSESSYKTLPERDTRSKDINITLNVAPRTKLGLGICKGPEWKPGIFVQFTKEKSVAREAGLRQGDQILSVNSIDFSDVLFSEAVAVMKSASKLEMVIRTAAGCDLFPGESSGYNSSASSVTGDQSPCWADAKSKRLTSVREEPTNAPCWNESAYAEQRRRVVEQQSGSNKQRRDAHEKKPVGSQQQVNKTIIKLSEQGTSINNTFVSNTQPIAAGRNTNEYGTPKVRSIVGGAHEVQPPTAPTTGASSNNSSYISREERETKTVVVEVHRQEADEAKRQQQQLQQKQSQQMQQQRVDLNSHYRHNALQPTHSLPNHSASMKQPEFQKCLRANSCSQQQQQLQPQQHQQQQQQAHLQKLQQQQGAPHGRNTCQVDSSSLSSAITEELKKRKEKQRINAATASNDNSNNNDNNNTNSHSNYMNIASKQNNYNQSRQQQQQQHHHTLHQPLSVKAQQQQSHCHSTPLSPSSSSLSLSATPTTPMSTSTTATAAATAALSARATSNNVNCSERNSHSHSHNHSNNSCNQSVPAAGTSAIAGVGVGAGDQHSALMDEFKRAHQRMFKNGFQETERKERQEALRNTTMMEDDVNHRTSRVFRNENGPTANGTQFQIPPPPPQFASSPPRTQPQYTSTNNKFSQQSQLQQKPINNYNNSSVSPLKPPTEQPPKPPATPVPDYDNVEIRTKATTISSSVRPSYAYASTNIVTNGRDATNDNSGNRRTLRAGTITIGEYEQPQQRREPAKFDFVGTSKRSSNGAIDVCADNLQAELQSTLTRSKLKKSAEPLEHQSNCPLRNSYDNYENVARKLHSVSINEVAATVPAVRISNGMPNGATNGILKNGNRHSGGVNGGPKNSDKTITFGN